jgi:hypothetical protein
VAVGTVGGKDPRILGDRVALGQLIEVVRQNSEALTRLSERLKGTNP